MNYLGFGLAVLASALWGLTYCLDERVLASLSVFKLYFLHCACGAVVAGAILLYQDTSLGGLFIFIRSAIPYEPRHIAANTQVRS